MRSKKLILPFSEILDAHMTAGGFNVRSFTKFLNEKGINVSPQRVSDYRNCSATPSYERARQILDALEYSMSEKDLIDSLKQNKDIYKSYEYKREDFLKASVSLKLKAIFPDKDVMETKRIVLDRIKELYGENGSFNTYLTDLVINDLHHSTLDKRKDNYDD